MILLKYAVNEIVLTVLLFVLHIHWLDSKRVVDKLILNNHVIKGVYNIFVVAPGFYMR